MHHMDDAALVEAARSGDPTAWAAIYDRYADKLHDHCHRILRDRDEAADALHDAFIAASRHLDQLRDPSRLRPWLYSICRHEALRRKLTDVEVHKIAQDLADQSRLTDDPISTQDIERMINSAVLQEASPADVARWFDPSKRVEVDETSTAGTPSPAARP